MKTYSDFQVVEYENIAKAHFETINQVSVFYRYYLLIMSAPSFILVLLNDKNNIPNESLEKVILVVLKNIFLFLPIIGLLVCVYLIYLRLDAILYARTVNGVRKYFFEKCKKDKKLLASIRTLPVDIKKPKYFELFGFLPVVLSFALINSIYFGVYFLLENGEVTFWQYLLLLVIGSLHIFVYWIMGIRREKEYK